MAFTKKLFANTEVQTSGEYSIICSNYSRTFMPDIQKEEATFSAVWGHEITNQDTCRFNISSFDIEASNHAIFHLFEYMVETLPGVDEMFLLIAQKIVRERSLKGEDYSKDN